MTPEEMQEFQAEVITKMIEKGTDYATVKLMESGLELDEDQTKAFLLGSRYGMEFWWNEGVRNDVAAQMYQAVLAITGVTPPD